jgi:3-hydroxyisobutyrate dehydrogenase/2-hydroxy-3-oxopropionate reductase
MTAERDRRLRVGVAGLGRMGSPIARNLAARGLLTGVHNRTSAIAKRFAAELDVGWFATPAALAQSADVVITTVADGDAVRDLYAGSDGFLAGLRPGTVAVEMSTVGPATIEWLDRALAAKDCRVVDAPVSGSVATAETGELTIMAGGDPEAFERVRPVLEAIGSRIFHVGATGAGATMKLVVNSVVYGLNQSVAESLVLAERAGIDRPHAYEVLASSAAAAPFVHYRRDAFERPGEIPVLMRLVLAEKDLALILDLAARLGASVPQAEVNAEVARAAHLAGYADDDISAVAQYLRGAS